MRKDGIFLLIPNPHHGEDVSVDLIKKVLPGEVTLAGVQFHLALRPDRPPALPDNIAASPDGPAHGQLPRAQPCLPGSHSRAATGRCCPHPRKDEDAGGCREILLKSLCASSVRSVPLVVARSSSVIIIG